MIGIYGAGALSGDVLDSIQAAKGRTLEVNELIVIDDVTEKTEHLGYRVMPFTSACEEYTPEQLRICVAVADPKGRSAVCDRVAKAGYSFYTAIHPTAHIDSTAIIGDGPCIRRDVLVGPRVVIGSNVHIQARTAVSHDSVVGDCSHIAFGCIVNGGTSVGERVYIGSGAIIRERTQIGEDSIVSMGAVVLKDVPSGMVVMGNPARVIAKNSDGVAFVSNA